MQIRLRLDELLQSAPGPGLAGEGREAGIHDERLARARRPGQVASAAAPLQIIKGFIIQRFQLSGGG